MEEQRPKSDDEQPAPAKGDQGEDHREGPPGYDLDEQKAIEELQSERDKG